MGTVTGVFLDYGIMIILNCFLLSGMVSEQKSQMEKKWKIC